MALCSVTANAVFARWPLMDREAIQCTSCLVPWPGPGRSHIYLLINHYLYKIVLRIPQDWIAVSLAPWPQVEPAELYLWDKLFPPFSLCYRGTFILHLLVPPSLSSISHLLTQPVFDYP